MWYIAARTTTAGSSSCVNATQGMPTQTYFIPGLHTMAYLDCQAHNHIKIMLQEQMICTAC